MANTVYIAQLEKQLKEARKDQRAMSEALDRARGDFERSREGVMILERRLIEAYRESK